MENSNKLGLIIADSVEMQNKQSSALLDPDIQLYTPNTLIIKIDDVLVDTSISTNEAFKQTYKYFTGKHLMDSATTYTRFLGGFDNKFKLVHHLIEEYGFNFAYDDVVRKFQDIYWNDSQGLIDSENLIVSHTFLSELASRYRLIAVSDAPEIEIDFKLHKFNLNKYFSYVLQINQINVKDNLLSYIKDKFILDDFWFIGTSIDDMKMCINEGIIGIAVCMANDIELRTMLTNNGAYSVIESISSIDNIPKNI